jgi:hypothetical protein
MPTQTSEPLVLSTLRTLIGLSVLIATGSLVPTCQVQALPTLATKIEKMSIETNSERTTFKLPQQINLASVPLDTSILTERSQQSKYIAQFDSSENVGTKDSAPLAVIQVGKKYGYQNAEGRTKIAAQFDNAYEFFDGLAAVNINGKWGFINRAGDRIVAMKFDNASSFCSGLAAVKFGDKWGFINQQGVTEIAHNFDEAETFSEGLAKVKIGDKWGFIDREGVMKIKPTFDEAASFNDRTAWVRIGKQVGYIDKTGKFVITSS